MGVRVPEGRVRLLGGARAYKWQKGVRPKKNSPAGLSLLTTHRQGSSSAMRPIRRADAHGSTAFLTPGKLRR